VLESTTYPGITEEVVKSILERAGLKSGTDFFLAYAPEREDSRIVGGDAGRAGAREDALRPVGGRDGSVPSPAVGEAVKQTKNIIRAVNLALVNELKIIYAAMGIDVSEVIEGAKTKPFGFMPFYPGPGLGGHCIPIDPFYLTLKAREYEVPTRFIELADEINTRMLHLVVARLAEAMDRAHGRGLSRSHVLLLGAAYKKNIDDSRESPALKLIELIEARGATVDYHDPHVPVLPPAERHGMSAMQSVPLDPERISGYDAVLIVTDHDAVDYAAVVRHAKLVVDTRNACHKHGFVGESIVKA